MKNHKTKTVLVLLATFALGIIFGAMLNRAIAQNRIKQYVALRTREGLMLRLRRIIGPDAVQAQEVRTILEKYGQRLGKINREMREQYRTTIGDFFEDLSGVLTPEQMKRVYDRMPLGRRMYRKERQRRPGQFRDGREFPGAPQKRFGPRRKDMPSQPVPGSKKKEIDSFKPVTSLQM